MLHFHPFSVTCKRAYFLVLLLLSFIFSEHRYLYNRVYPEYLCSLKFCFVYLAFANLSQWEQLTDY